MEHVPWARDLARGLLAEALPRRWSHVQGVARQAEAVAGLVGDDGDLLVSAAWLHDIGYAPPLAKTGSHPLDGARHLRDAVGADPVLCRLVAHHSWAVVEAGKRGLADVLAAEFAPVEGLIADALTYCDMTTGPGGERVTVQARLAEVVARYGEGDPVTESINAARDLIVGSVRRVGELVEAQAAG